MAASRDRSQLRLNRVFRITLIWVLVGFIAALFEHNVLLSYGIPSTYSEHLNKRLFTSVLAGFIGGGFYILFFRDRLRKYAFVKAITIMAVIMFIVILFTGAIVPALSKGGPFADVFLEHLNSPRFLGQYIFWTLLTGGSMFMVRLNDQFGSGGIAYLTGRYHKPQQEMRVFMFLDMRSSTAIAERLGNVKYFQLLNELYTDITDPIVDARGEIYQYVGDEVSVTWPLRRGIVRHRCIMCFFEIRKKLRARAPYYKKRYGIEPLFKAGFHYGEVTAGEVGQVKKERIFSGDVVNTAARIQNSCNAHGVDNLISKDLLDVLQLPESFKVREIGNIDLRGKRFTTSLWTLEE
ncbi:MAG: adenylate/guanylate cyclase domain-containing protein [Flavobacteriales bacterium]